MSLEAGDIHLSSLGGDKEAIRRSRERLTKMSDPTAVSLSDCFICGAAADQHHAEVAALHQALADLTDAAESIGDHPVPRGLLVALRDAAAAARRTLAGD